MNDISVLLHAGIAIALVIILIVWPRIDPAISLLVGAVYLGLASGVGFAGTTEAIAAGFGDVMVSVGLVIGLGILLGSLLVSMGTVQGIVDKLLRWLSPRQLPYATGAALSTIFPVIYADVLLVLIAPLARTLAPRLGRGGLAKISVVLSMGIGVGLVFVVPGAGAIAISGLLDIPLGTMLIAGLLVALPTLFLVILVTNRLANRGFWNSATDEMVYEASTIAVPGGTEKREPGSAVPAGKDLPHHGGGEPSAAPGDPATKTLVDEPSGAALPIRISIIPIILVLVLITAGVVASLAGANIPVLTFLADPAMAILIALIVAYLLTWKSLSKHEADSAMGRGFTQSGTVLILTGAGGSLGAVIEQSGLEEVIGGFFSTSTVAPLLLVWAVGAVLVLALGSPTVALLTAGGILAPIMGTLDISPVLVALAAASGSLFAVHVNANYFWMFKSLLGLSTRGTLKTLTVPGALASVISIVLILLASVVIGLL